MNIVCPKCGFERDQYFDGLVKQGVCAGCSKKYNGISKWVYAIPVIVIVLVVSISYFSDFGEAGTKATKAPTFDIQGYYNKYKDYYGDIPLDEVAKAVYARTFANQYPDYNSWKKAVGIESLIQEDTKRRTPPPPSFLGKIMGALPFRYDEEYIQGRLFRYDRFNKTVEQRQGIDESTAQWVPRPQFKNLQHVRDFMARWERNSQNEELERKQKLQQWKTAEQAEELNHNIKGLKNTVETMKREQEFRGYEKKID